MLDSSTCISLLSEMNINERFRRASLTQLIRWWNGEETPGWAHETCLFLPKIANALSKIVPEGVEFLKRQARSDDLQRHALALSCLSKKRIADEEIVCLLIDAFRRHRSSEPKADAGLKTLALNGLVAIERYPLGRAEVEPLLEHEDKWLGAAAMVYLSHAVPEEAVKILRAGLRSRNPIRRGQACTEAGFRKIRILRKEVATLLKDGNEYVARSAQIGCEVLNLT